VITVERTDFVSVIVRDLDRARTFYGETLGIRPNPTAHESYPEFETGNLTIALRAEADFTPSSAAIALRVPDVDGARRTLSEAGIEFDGETFDTGVCHVAFFKDPDGNALMLHRRYAD
jgi:catechol 2,3-dioxygenase-like lactoylglutathione lyase family enzyme